jgi:hypothetical protein
VKGRGLMAPTLFICPLSSFSFREDTILRYFTRSFYTLARIFIYQRCKLVASTGTRRLSKGFLVPLLNRFI